MCCDDETARRNENETDSGDVGRGREKCRKKGNESSRRRIYHLSVAVLKLICMCLHVHEVALWKPRENYLEGREPSSKNLGSLVGVAFFRNYNIKSLQANPNRTSFTKNLLVGPLFNILNVWYILATCRSPLFGLECVMIPMDDLLSASFYSFSIYVNNICTTS